MDVISAIDSSPSIVSTSPPPSYSTVAATSPFDPSSMLSPLAEHKFNPPPSSRPAEPSLKPEFPFTVPLPYLPGSTTSMHPSLGAHAPLLDDHDVQSRLPTICVDYLSHDWEESDVWTTWKAMTKRKSSANDTRLENASWRTWAKRKGNLKTIPPQSLNWLKDGDVTWLYGPLHTAEDIYPKPSPYPNEPVASRSITSPSSEKARTKPILKHRSFTDILILPLLQNKHLHHHQHHTHHFDNNDNNDNSSDTSSEDQNLPAAGPSYTSPTSSMFHRPRFYSTNSDSNLEKQNSHYLSSDADSYFSSSYFSNSNNNNDGSSNSTTPTINITNTSTSSNNNNRSRHISFNQHVEQCIAFDEDDDALDEVDDETADSDYSADDIYGVDDAADDEEDSQEEGDDDDESVDEILTFRTSRYRSASSSSSSRSSSRQTTPLSNNNRQCRSTPDGNREHLTIAKLAPTTLKPSDPVPSYPSVAPYRAQPLAYSTNSFLSSAVSAQDYGFSTRDSYQPHWDCHVAEVDDSDEQEPDQYTIDYDYATGATNIDPDGDICLETVASLDYCDSTPSTPTTYVPPANEIETAAANITQTIKAVKDKAIRSSRSSRTSMRTSAPASRSTSSDDQDDCRGRSTSRRRKPSYEDRVIPVDSRPLKTSASLPSMGR